MNWDELIAKMSNIKVDFITDIIYCYLGKPPAIMGFDCYDNHISFYDYSCKPLLTDKEGEK